MACRPCGDDAVSPVVGVLLMTAIVVVLAAVVFVTVQDAGNVNEPAPNIAFTRDEHRDQWAVARADTALDWDEFQIRVTNNGTDIHYAINSAPSTSDTQVTNVMTAMPARSLSSSDYVQFCGASADTDLDFSIMHFQTNTLVATTNFLSIAACSS